MRVVESAMWSAAMLAVVLSFLSLLSPWYFSREPIQGRYHIGPWLSWTIEHIPNFTGSLGLYKGAGDRNSTCRVSTMLAVLTSVALLASLITDYFTQRSENPHDAWLTCCLLSAGSTVLLTSICMIIWLIFLGENKHLVLQVPFGFLIFHLLTGIAATVLCSKLHWDRKHSDLGCTCETDHDCSHSHSHLGMITSSSGHVLDLDHYASVIAQREYQEQNPDVIAMTELPQNQRIMEREEPNVGTTTGTDRTQMGRTDGDAGTSVTDQTQAGRTDGRTDASPPGAHTDGVTATTPATQQPTSGRTDGGAGAAQGTERQQAGQNAGSTGTTARERPPTGRTGGNVQNMNRNAAAGQVQGRRRTGNN